MLPSKKENASESTLSLPPCEEPKTVAGNDGTVAPHSWCHHCRTAFRLVLKLGRKNHCSKNYARTPLKILTTVTSFIPRVKNYQFSRRRGSCPGSAGKTLCSLTHLQVEYRCFKVKNVVTLRHVDGVRACVCARVYARACASVSEGALSLFPLRRVESIWGLG